MDFLKTLLIYMSVLFTMGVESTSTPAPGAVPTPSPTPVPAVTEEAAAATSGALVIATPAGETPAPTITPNAKYTKLSYGDRNNNVKKMQQRLIELGYLSGTADGAFGMQTLNAVRAFQKANGLTADGIAGKATLTHLYEDKQVVAAATATPKATATPMVVSAQAASAEEGGEPAAQSDSLIAGWYKTGATVLMNGEKIVLLDRSGDDLTERCPGVYLHDGTAMISLTELAKAAGWTVEFTDGSACTVNAAGYTVEVKSLRVVNGSGDAYTATVDGVSTDFADGQIVYSDGDWFVSGAFLEKTVGASVIWYQEENTLVLHVTDKSQAGSRD